MALHWVFRWIVRSTVSFYGVYARSLAHLTIPGLFVQPKGGTYADLAGVAVDKAMAMTSGRGVDVAIEAVGVPGTFDICEGIIAPGGHIANVDVHGESVPLHLERLWSQNITITTRLVDAVTTPLLPRLFFQGSYSPGSSSLIVSPSVRS